MDDLSPLSDAELIKLWAATMRELRRRGIARSNNNLVADYGELRVAERLSLTLASKSTRGYDATDAGGARYQIKSQRITSERARRQMGAIRNLDDHEFDWLVAALFDEDLNLLEMWQLSHSTVARYARYVAHTNSYSLALNSAVLRSHEVRRLA